MTQDPFQLAPYLHDAQVNRVDWSVDDRGNRRIRMELRCDCDCGYTDWNDKSIAIEFHDVVIAFGTLFGYVSNAETLDSLDQSTSSEIAATLDNLAEHGITSPAIVISVCFHSGSMLEVACNAVSIHALPK